MNLKEIIDQNFAKIGNILSAYATTSDAQEQLSRLRAMPTHVKLRVIENSIVPKKETLNAYLLELQEALHIPKGLSITHAKQIVRMLEDVCSAVELTMEPNL